MSDHIPVVINLVTKVKEGSREETTSNQVKGTLVSKRDTTYIRYSEEIEDTGSVRNVMKITADEVTIIRNGSVGMHQRFREGEVTEGHYKTPFGTMHMKTDTKHINYEWERRQGYGKFELTYGLTLQGHDLGRVTLTFVVKEVGS
jgi:uncharacterized beta-barrel protein YwiB (DUF1934 family)